MALIESLIDQIENEALRKAIGREVVQLKKRLAWGLVYEQHIPETTLLSGAPIRPGTFVWERRSTKPRRLRVEEVEGDQLVVVPQPNGTIGAGDPESVDRVDVLSERTLGEPIYPALRGVGSVRRGHPDRPAHVVINGENYHALELLTLTHAGKVDICYLDPPFNTGARDWRYNNRYVDQNDSYRHSKWLSMMEKRLRLCRRLLRPDGVIVVAIDEHEVFHLGMLLEQMFPDAQIQMVTVVINTKGVTQERLSRVEEHLMYCFFGNVEVFSIGDDLLTHEERSSGGERPGWRKLLRSGEASRRQDRPGMFFPIWIEAATRRIVDVGEALPGEVAPDFGPRRDGSLPIWPVRQDRALGRWGVGPQTLRQLVASGYVRVGRHDAGRNTWAVSYLTRELVDQIDAGVLRVATRDPVTGVADVVYEETTARRIKTVWNRTRHNAGTGGSNLLTTFLGQMGAFSFPKSLYSVADALEILVRRKPNAVIVDPFAGSGTTLHAVALLNAKDGGRRQCFLITNNEVAYATERRLNRDGLFRGDPAFDRHGIFEAVTVPRVNAAITGRRPDNSEVPGEYLDGRPYARGFEENIEFFELIYMDPLEVELGRRFAELVPTLWLAAGATGERNGVEAGRFAVPDGVPYAFLFDAADLRELVASLDQRPDVVTVFIQAASDEAFADLREQLPERLNAVKLYGAYIDHFRRAVR